MTLQGRKWLPKTGWASSNLAHCCQKLPITPLTLQVMTNVREVEALQNPPFTFLIIPCVIRIRIICNLFNLFSNLLMP